MTYAQRKQTAIENVRVKLDEARETREWAQQEAARQSQEDEKETDCGEIDPFNGQVCTSAGHTRAVSSIREILRRRDEASQDEEDECSVFDCQPSRRQTSGNAAEAFFGDDDGDGDFG